VRCKIQRLSHTTSVIDTVAVDMTMIGADHRKLVPSGGISARLMQAKTERRNIWQHFKLITSVVITTLS
jgi:hypothetical protein